MLRHKLIEHFANVRNIEDPALSEGPNPAIWREVLPTGIMIETTHRWRGDLVEKRPAILLSRNAYRNLRVSIGDREAVDGRGWEHFVTLWVGSHTLFCIHGSGASCEILATEVQRELTEFGPAIVQQLGLHKFQVTEVGAIGEVEEARQNYVVPITVGWAYQQTWKLEPAALPLKAVNFEIDLNDF